MSETNEPSAEGTSPSPAAARPSRQVPWSEWALAILLTMLIGLSAAALLAAFVMELMFDSASAWTRIAVLAPVLLIASYLLVQHWRQLFNRRDVGKK